MIKDMFTTRRLALMALFVAMSAALAPYSIWLNPQQKLLSLSFLPLAVGSVIFGPMAAVLMGVVSDTVNYMIKPVGAYFPGYAVSLAFSCLIYAFWQYKRPLKLWRIACAQACNIVVVYFGLNLLWQSILAGRTAAEFFTWIRLINNTIQFPFVVAVIYGLAKVSELIERRYVKNKSGDGN